MYISNRLLKRWKSPFFVTNQPYHSLIPEVAGLWQTRHILSGTPVVDLGADFRLSDADAYPTRDDEVPGFGDWDLKEHTGIYEAVRDQDRRADVGADFDPRDRHVLHPRVLQLEQHRRRDRFENRAGNAFGTAGHRKQAGEKGEKV